VKRGLGRGVNMRYIVNMSELFNVRHEVNISTIMPLSACFLDESSHGVIACCCRYHA
jgi:hypothetical protein